jgi:hypothetical protein
MNQNENSEISGDDTANVPYISTYQQASHKHKYKHQWQQYITGVGEGGLQSFGL